MKWIVLTLAVLATLAGCGPTVIPPADGGILVMYTREGGIGGLEDTLVVRNDGSMTLTDRSGKDRHGNVPAADLAELKRLLESPEFKALAESYGDSSGADRMTHTVEVIKVRKVKTRDGADHPETLKQILGEINRLLGEIK